MRLIYGPDGVSRRTLAYWRKHGVKWHILVIRLGHVRLSIEAKAQFAIGAHIDGSKNYLEITAKVGPFDVELLCKR